MALPTETDMKAIMTMVNNCSNRNELVAATGFLLSGVQASLDNLDGNNAEQLFIIQKMQEMSMKKIDKFKSGIILPAH